MSIRSLAKRGTLLPSVFDDFFKPWNELEGNGGLFWDRMLTVPAVNVIEEKDDYKVTLAVPGMKKDDFVIDLDGNVMTISCEKEETKEEKEKTFTRREFSYNSFSRSFTLPEEVNREKIDAKYDNGMLTLLLPKKEEAKKAAANKHITVK